MNTYILESLEDGSHGIIPSEGINYFVGKKRIVVHKDGKKVIDKEIDINPDGTISKYNLICDDDKEPELEPVKDVEEYNVANMLPQVYPEDAVLKKESEEEYEEINITDDDLVSESVSAGAIAAIVGGTVVLSGVLAIAIKWEIDKRKAIDWYADQHEVSPKFSELTKKNYKVKYDSKKKDVELTNEEKKFNFDKNNVAEIYFYKDKRVFGIIYGCNVENVFWTPAYTSVNYRINVRIVVYDPKFKEHIEYYAAKSMIKHKYTMRSIDDWVRGITQEYRKAKKDEKKVAKESDLSIEDLTNDFNVMIENCDNILNKIAILKESTTAEDSEGEFITESMIDHVNTLEESAASNKVKKVAKSTLNKVEKFVSEKIDLLKDLKKEPDKLKKNDIKKKLVKNQKEFRSYLKDCDPATKKKLHKHYSGINLSTIDQINLNNFMDQVRRDSEDAIRANEEAMRASQTAINM